MIVDWSGQHLYVGTWNSWSYNPYGVEEGAYVPATLNYYGDSFGVSRPAIFTDMEIDNRYIAGLRPDIFINVKSDTKYSGECKPEVLRSAPINVDPQPYLDQVPVNTGGQEPKYTGGMKPVIRR